MAKIGYSFDNGRRAFSTRTKRNNGRLFIIGIVILLLCGGIYFMFFRSDNNTIKKPPTLKIAAKEERLKLSEISPPKQSTKKRQQAITPITPSISKQPSTKTSIIVNALCEKAIAAVHKQEYALARKLTLKALQQPAIKEYSADWLKIAEVLSQANSALINSDIPLADKKVRYRVQQGDALQKIAKKFKTTVELIQRGNNMKTNNYIVWEGQNLKIYRGDWNIKISKTHRLLSLYDGNELFKIYHIGIGRQNRTPECTFTIIGKKKNPSWYKSQKEIIPFGTKENVLGTRWLALKASDAKLQHLTGYGIHGTWDNKSIGKAMSNGCIRMKNHEVEELFAIVPYHTKVVINK